LGILLGIKDQGGEVAGSDRVIVGCREVCTAPCPDGDL
jgi:hypothetical protein